MKGLVRDQSEQQRREREIETKANSKGEGEVVAALEERDSLDCSLRRQHWRHLLWQIYACFPFQFYRLVFSVSLSSLLADTSISLSCLLPPPRALCERK